MQDHFDAIEFKQANIAGFGFDVNIRPMPLQLFRDNGLLHYFKSAEKDIGKTEPIVFFGRSGAGNVYGDDQIVATGQ